MVFGGRYRDDRRICIICGRTEGTVRTVDGLVCAECMPSELLCDAGRVKTNHIRRFKEENPGWRSVSGIVHGPAPKVEIADRSGAITPATPTTLAEELIAQILVSDTIDIVVSFVHMSGISLILGPLREFCENGRLRVITTAYLGYTEYEALHELFRLPNTEVRMELEADRSRIHAKSFIFGREDGKGTAFVGSANLSKSALTDGEEWVVKLREQDVPEVMRDLRTSFDELWSSGSVRKVTARDRADIESALERRGRQI